MPAPIVFDGQRLPASYANFYIANGLVLVPTFNDVNDRKALGILAELFPDREVVGIHCGDLVYGLGHAALHDAAGTGREPIEPFCGKPRHGDFALSFFGDNSSSVGKMPSMAFNRFCTSSRFFASGIECRRLWVIRILFARVLRVLQLANGSFDLVAVVFHLSKHVLSRLIAHRDYKSVVHRARAIDMNLHDNKSRRRIDFSLR